MKQLSLSGLERSASLPGGDMFTVFLLSLVEVSGTKNVSNTSYEQTTPTPRVTDGLTGTTSSPSAIITAAGDDTAAVTSGTKDGSISQQAAATAAATTTAAAQPEMFSVRHAVIKGNRQLVRLLAFTLTYY